MDLQQMVNGKVAIVPGINVPRAKTEGRVITEKKIGPSGPMPKVATSPIPAVNWDKHGAFGRAKKA